MFVADKVAVFMANVDVLAALWSWKISAVADLVTAALILLAGIPNVLVSVFHF